MLKSKDERMTTGYKLFLDDIITVDMVYPEINEDDFIIVRNFENFKLVIPEKGLPESISFDNDLGLDINNIIAPRGYAAAKWLVYESGLNLTDLKFSVHPANPVVCKRILPAGKGGYYAVR